MHDAPDSVSMVGREVADLGGGGRGVVAAVFPSWDESAAAHPDLAAGDGPATFEAAASAWALLRSDKGRLWLAPTCHLDFDPGT